MANTTWGRILREKGPIVVKKTCQYGFGASLAYLVVKKIIDRKTIEKRLPRYPEVYAQLADFCDKVSEIKQFSSREEELAFKILYLRQLQQSLWKDGLMDEVKKFSESSSGSF